MTEGTGDDMMDWQPVLLSLKIAAMSLAGVAVAGIGAAYLLTRRDFPGKNLCETLLTLPLVLPPIVTGFLLLVLVGRQGPIGKLLNQLGGFQIVFTPFAAVLAAAAVAFPLMYQSAKAALQGVNHHLEDAARTLGAGEWKVFRTVTLPLARQGIYSGMVLAFSRALGEFGATAMVAGNIPGRTQTIPVAIYFASESNDLTTAGLYVLIISVLTFGMVYGVNHWLNKSFGKWARRRWRVRSGHWEGIAGVSASSGVQSGK
ncbi:molybdate transport system permease protein [Hydrogenispora ethanolica]|uniref:Molybdenum transport system permease n=2 Tax=Hydrogenispora ethanolica TaxID=1082276 RepID=A0A4R1S1Z8_HYDET|nr:molybdate transport system permease protein [Hydrogenispora ethanolica]